MNLVSVFLFTVHSHIDLISSEETEVCFTEFYLFEIFWARGVKKNVKIFTDSR